MLLSVEGGSYIEASIRAIEKVITYVGAGYLVEKDVEGAKAYIGRNVESSEDADKAADGGQEEDSGRADEDTVLDREDAAGSVRCSRA